MGTDVIEAARLFAYEAHGAIGQVRKYSGDPYIVHPQAVARLVADAGGDEAMIAAAWLHDVVEDTPVGIPAIRTTFGDDVGDLVDWLTDISRPADVVRAIRKAMDRERMADAPPRAKAIKLADLIDNSRSIVAHDPSFATVYLREKEAVLKVLAGAADECRAAGVLLPVARALLIAGNHALLIRNAAA